MSDTAQPDGIGGKLVVVALLLVVLAGVAWWALTDANKPALDPKTGKRFAAAFEKECVSKTDARSCKSLLGAHHAACLRACASRSDAGVSYDAAAYRQCMLRWLPKPPADANESH